MGKRANVNRLIQDRLRECSRLYAEQLPAQIDEVLMTWAAMQSDSDDSAPADRFHLLVHGLAGSGATFGYPSVSEIACRMQRLTKPLVGGADRADPRDDGEVAKMMEPLLNRLAACVSDAIVLPPEPSAPDFRGAEADSGEKPVLLLGEDSRYADTLAAELAHFGYAVTVVDRPTELSAALERIDPVALVVADGYGEQPAGGIDVVRAHPRLKDGQLPIVFVSKQEDIDSRLAAVRAGGADYLVKPFDPLQLVERLDRLTARDGAEPYRIMLVEDDAMLAAGLTAALEAAGMTVTTLGDPRQVFAMLADRAPELILLDLYLPYCSGLELAKLIRQQDTFTGIPIVFLSSETSIDRQMLAMSMGGDDFLTKPIMPARLVASVTSRVRRARLVRSMMVRDSLTGLLNHASLLDRLTAEVCREQRQDGRIAFALLDIDQFKQINDRYGHPAGDRVLTNLSRLLKQRLRKSDIVGRYGGEEFGIVLPDTSPEEAAKVVDNLRRVFQSLHYEADGEKFQVTFSCGIAAWPDCRCSSSLVDAADRALYLAKRAGRNRIVLASEAFTDPV